MILSNRFNKTDMQRIWQDLSACAICRSNQGCSIHHIYSTVSSSPYNSILLCQKCHTLADSHNTFQMGDENRIFYLSIALKYVSKSGYKNTQKDIDFLNSIKSDFMKAKEILE